MHKVLVCLILSAIAWRAEHAPAQQTPATQTGAEGATRPAPRDALEQIERILELDRREKLILSDVQDHSRQLDEPGLYLMLAKTARLGQLTDEQFRQLDQPAYRNLLKKPRRYRGMPIRMSVRAYAVKKLHAGAGGGLSPSRYWPRDKTVWRMDCLHAPEGQTRRKEPVRIFSVADPAEMLGEPDKIENGEMIYSSGRRLALAGVFYKVYKGGTRKDKQADSPVVVLLAWQFRSGSGGLFMQTASHPIVITAIAAAVLLAGGYIIVRRRISRIRRAQTAQREYRPRRHEPPPREQAPAPEDDNIDPLLKEAVEDFQREARRKRQENDQNDKS